MSKTRNKFSPEVREEASRRTAPAAQAADDKARLKLLEREVKEQRRANEILRKVSVRTLSLGPEALGPNLLRRNSTAKANGVVLHRRAPRGSGYRADLPGTDSRPFL